MGGRYLDVGWLVHPVWSKFNIMAGTPYQFWGVKNSCDPCQLTVHKFLGTEHPCTVSRGQFWGPTGHTTLNIINRKNILIPIFTVVRNLIFCICSKPPPAWQPWVWASWNTLMQLWLLQGDHYQIQQFWTVFCHLAVDGISALTKDMTTLFANKITISLEYHAIK